jgi:uridylate kinase
VIVKLEGGSEELARQLAMHISFAAPGVAEQGRRSRRDRSRPSAGLSQLGRAAGKPEQAKEKIVEGMLAKRFYAMQPGGTLTEQPWIHDSAKTVGQALDEAGRVSSRSSVSLSQNRRVTTHEELAERAPSGAAPAFRRVLLKLSGEALMGDHDYGTDPKTVDAIAREIVGVQREGLELAIVVGGGNIYRGISPPPRGWTGPPRTTPGCSPPSSTRSRSRTRSSGSAPTRACSPRSRSRGRRAVHPAPGDAAPREGPDRHLRRGHGQPVLHHRHGCCAARTRDRRRGDPDGEERIMGVYDGDPKDDPDATFLPALTHLEAIERGLRVMDTTALSLCMENSLPIHVFELAEGNILRVATGEQVGTVISTPSHSQSPKER